MRREATVVMHTLFSFPSHRDRERDRGRNSNRNGNGNRIGNDDRGDRNIRVGHGRGNNQGTTALLNYGRGASGNRVAYEDGGLMVIDGDTWQDENPVLYEANFPSLQVHGGGSSNEATSNNSNSYSNEHVNTKDVASAANAATNKHEGGSKKNEVEKEEDTKTKASAIGWSRLSKTYQQPSTYNPDSFPVLGSASNTLKSSTAKNSRAEALKPKAKVRKPLVLKPRSQPPDLKLGAQVSISTSPPLTQDSTTRLGASQQLEKYQQLPEQRFPSQQDSKGLLCPYPPILLKKAREFGINWLTSLELRLEEFVNSPPVITPLWLKNPSS